jgi:hypothetical protein
MTLSPGANTGCLYGLNAQHDPRQASSLAWRTRGNDDGLLSALQPIESPLRVWRSAARAGLGDTAYSRGEAAEAAAFGRLALLRALH